MELKPNELRITRVFVRKDGELAMDDTLFVGDPTEIVVEWEAGATANADVAANVSFQVSVYDHTDGDRPLFFDSASVPPIPAQAPSGLNQSCIYEVVVDLGAATYEADHFYEIRTSLLRTTKTFSSYKGPLFYVNP